MLVVHVTFDEELDKDIIAQMPSWGKGPWVKDRVIQALNNESLLSEQKIISVLEKYLAQKNLSLTDIENDHVPRGSTLTVSPSRSSEEKFSEETPEKTSTWRMPE